MGEWWVAVPVDAKILKTVQLEFDESVEFVDRFDLLIELSELIVPANEFAGLLEAFPFAAVVFAFCNAAAALLPKLVELGHLVLLMRGQ